MIDFIFKSILFCVWILCELAQELLDIINDLYYLLVTRLDDWPSHRNANIAVFTVRKYIFFMIFGNKLGDKTKQHKCHA